MKEMAETVNICEVTDKLKKLKEYNFKMKYEDPD